jgi:hypothetical protein
METASSLGPIYGSTLISKKKEKNYEGKTFQNKLNDSTDRHTQ